MTGPTIGPTYVVYTVGGTGHSGLTLTDVVNLYTSRQGRPPRRLVIAADRPGPDSVAGVPVEHDDTGRVRRGECWAVGGGE